MKDTNTVLLAVVGALVIGLAGFMVGRHTGVGFGKFASEKRAIVAGDRNGAGMMAGKRRNMMGGDFRGRAGMMGGFGEITKIDGNTVSLKIDETTTKEVTLSADAVVNTMAKGTTADLKVGQTIMISGGGFWNDTQTVIVKPE